jgi:hypothetical protein
MNGKLGSASVVIYFVNHTDPKSPLGYIALAPYSGCPPPEGWSVHEADDLPSVRRLEKSMQEQEIRFHVQDYLREQQGIGKLQSKVRERLYAKLFSNSTSEYEKDYIREWIKLKDEQKAEKYRKMYEDRILILHQLHYDIPKDRDANEEVAEVDRIG